MTIFREEQMNSYEGAFVEAIQASYQIQDSHWDPREILKDVRIGLDGTPRVPVGAILLAELVEWQTLGIALGIFAGEPQYFAAVQDSGAQRVYFELMGGRKPADRPGLMGNFLDTIAAATEDLRPERIELLRLLMLAPAEELYARIDEIHDFAAQVENGGIQDLQDVDHISWALSGRDSALEGLTGPARWRTNAILKTAPGFELLNQAGGRLAFATLLAARSDGESISEIIQTVREESGGYGPPEAAF